MKDPVKIKTKKPLSEESLELLKMLRGCEIRTQLYVSYHGVVGLQLNPTTQYYEVVDGGKILDTLNSDKKVKALWKDYCAEEGF